MSEPIVAVEVDWEDFPDAIYLRGHWPADHLRAEEALEVARAEFGRQAETHKLLDDLPEGEEWPCPPVGIRRLLWARWVPSRSGDWDMDFLLQTHAGRGAFPVTEVLDLAEQARQQERQREREMRKSELEARIRTLYPEATEINTRIYSPGCGRVVFRVPGLEGSVWWSEADAHVVAVENRDIEAWKRLYAGRAAAAGSEP